MGTKEILYGMNPFHRIADKTCEEIDQRTNKLIENQRKITEKAFDLSLSNIQHIAIGSREENYKDFTANTYAKLIGIESSKPLTIEKLEESYEFANKLFEKRGSELNIYMGV